MACRNGGSVVFNAGKELLLNSTVWLCAVALLALVWQYLRLRRDPKGSVAARYATARFLASPVLLLGFGAWAALRAGFALYIAYVDPADIMQDIVSAQQ